MFSDLEVNMVTLQAQKQFRFLQQFINNCPVWVMAGQAVFHHRRMLKSEWTLLVSMALEAHAIRSAAWIRVTAAVGIVTIQTGHLVFSNRMM